jgi:DHA1 family inner membrane transport protein
VTDTPPPDAAEPEPSWLRGVPTPPRVVRPEVFDPTPPPRPEPTRDQALRALLPLFVLDILTAFTVGMLPPLLPLVAADWALSPLEVGLINTVYAIGRLAGSYPASLIRARRGTRAAVFLGVGFLVTGSALCAVAPRFPVFLLARLVMGFGASLAFLAVFAQLLESSPPAGRGRVANAFEATSILSLAVGGALAAALAQAAGWRVVFVATALVLLPCVATWRPIGPDAGRHPAAAGGSLRLPGAAVLALAPIYAAGFALAATWSGLFATLVPLVGHDRYGLDSGALGLALGAGYVAELVGLLAVGVVIDRAPREPLFMAGAVAVTLGGLLLAVGTRPAVFVGAVALIGGGYAVWMIPATVLADRVGPAIPPGHLAAFRVAMDTGMILGPVVLGALAGLAGERWAVGVAGFVLIGGALVLGRRRPSLVR